MSIHNATEADFESHTSRDGVVVVDFWAPWCGPCKRLAPTFERLAGTMTDVHFVKVNTDEAGPLAQSMGIMSIPTLMIFKNGKNVDQAVGALPEAQLEEFIKKHA